jgi:hypothetical protein
MTFDSIIAVGIVIGAAFYLYRKFTKKSKSGGCGCSSGGGCGGTQKHMDSTHCGTTKH